MSMFVRLKSIVISSFSNPYACRRTMHVLELDHRKPNSMYISCFFDQQHFCWPSSIIHDSSKAHSYMLLFLRLLEMRDLIRA